MKQYYKEIDGKNVFFDGVLVIGEMQIINPSEEQLVEDGWREWVEPIVPEPEPTEEEMLENAKSQKIAEIDEYDQSSYVNSFFINGQEMWLDVSVRQQLRTSVTAYQSLGKDNVTKWFGGVEYTFTTTQWLQMLDLLEVYAAEALNVTESHKAAINALDNIQDIEEYDITDGYPEKLEF